MPLEKNLKEPVHQDVQEMVEKHHEIMKNLNLSFKGEALHIQEMVDKHHEIQKNINMINMNMNEEVLPFNNSKDNKRKNLSESFEQKNKLPCKESKTETPGSLQNKFKQFKQNVLLSQASTSQGFPGLFTQDLLAEKLEELKHSLSHAVDAKKSATQRLEVAENKILEIIKKLDQKCDSVDSIIQPPDCFNNEFLELDQDLNKSYKSKETALKELESIEKKIVRLNTEIAKRETHQQKLLTKFPKLIQLHDVKVHQINMHFDLFSKYECFHLPKKTDPEEVEKIINKLPTRTYSLPSNEEKINHNKDCYICHAEFLNDEILRRLPCEHEYHTSCLDPWLKKELTCPVCRVSVTKPN